MPNAWHKGKELLKYINSWALTLRATPWVLLLLGPSGDFEEAPRSGCCPRDSDGVGERGCVVKNFPRWSSEDWEAPGPILWLPGSSTPVHAQAVLMLPGSNPGSAKGAGYLTHLCAHVLVHQSEAVGEDSSLLVPVSIRRGSHAQGECWATTGPVISYEDVGGTLPRARPRRGEVQGQWSWGVGGSLLEELGHQSARRWESIEGAQILLRRWWKLWSPRKMCLHTCVTLSTNVGTHSPSKATCSPQVEIRYHFQDR